MPVASACHRSSKVAGQISRPLNAGGLSQRDNRYQQTSGCTLVYLRPKENLASGPLVMLVRPSLQTATTAGFRRVSRRTAGVLMLGLWLGLLGLASSERLHHLLHADSNQANHECLITLISKGHLLGAFIPTAVMSAVFVCIGLCHSAEKILLSIADIRLAPSRAPPVGSLLQ